MNIRLFILLFLLTSLYMPAQTASGVVYPLAECNGGTCPGVTTVKSHITCTFVDSLTETLYVGGQFRSLGGQTRIGIGAIDGANGTLLSFAPVIDTFGCIYAMGIKGDTLFIGGRFTTVNGTARSNFAAIRISTGSLLPTFNTGIGGAGDTVFAITVYQGRIYVGGKFTTVFGQARSNIARLNYNGTVNSWYPSGAGIVRKTQQSAGRIVMIEDVGVTDSRVVKYDTTASPTALSLLLTTNSFAGNQDFQDFIIRNDSVYATGNFYEVETVSFDGFVVACISNGNNRAWGISIPMTNISSRHKIRIEYYRDSVYILMFEGLTQTQPWHSLYVAHYRGSALRTMKVYNSNASGLNGWYGQDIVISNARLFEVERFAQHTAFPNGSNSCAIYSYCLKIPTLCGVLLPFPANVCPGDTFWVAVQHQSYYASYNWTTISPFITLYPAFDSCMVVTTASYTGSSVRVQGVTSCGVMNTSQRFANTNDWPLPSVSAGPDDSLNCIVTNLTLSGSGSSVYPPIIWSWSGPSGFSTADSLFINAPGNYAATVEDANGCTKSDTAFVFADTIPPTLVPFTAPIITCTNDSVILDASPQYPNDSLRWSIGAGTYPNPALVTASGNVLLVVTDRDNGCSSTDTLFVSQNTLPPNASIIYTDTLLTCSVDSILLSGNSTATGGATFYWRDTALTVFSDPFWVTIPGAYMLTATGNINGCTTTVGPFYVNGWYTLPDISVATDTFSINCSYDSVLLNGSSLTLSATLQWTDSISFNAGNPAMTGTQGMYYLVATDSLNGCVAIDSAYVGFEARLDVVGYNDTAICPGSGAVLNAFPIGGTSPYTYQWNNSAGNIALVTVYPNDTLQYIVSVTDGAGCVGEDTVIVNVPDPILDSVLAFQPCDPLQPTGQIQVYPWGGVPPYQFSIDNGLSWQPNGVFGGLTYGTYNVLIADAISCSQNATGIIDTNSLSPAPEFLVSTSPELGDTIVIVDISNPRPDSVEWIFPANTTIVDTSMFSPAIIPGDTGAFTISMHAFYGTCEVVLNRLVNIQPFDSTNANPWMLNAIDSLILYPNPNGGTFTVHTELEGKQDFVILIFDELGNERGRQQVYDADEWTGQMSVSNPVPGNYILRVIAEFDSAEIVFVISQ
jgi:hypothetical protein